MAFPALVDACVLVPYRLTDLLLRLAEADTYRLLWSEQILAEVQRNLPKVGVTPAQASRRVGAMRRAFPDALVTGYEPLIDAMTNDPGDRHVLAAAVRAGAEVIVTANLRHFPPVALDPYEITAVHPDEFLLDQFDLYPERTATCIRELVADCAHPPITIEAFLAGLAKVAPQFSTTVRESGMLAR